MIALSWIVVTLAFDVQAFDAVHRAQDDAASSTGGANSGIEIGVHGITFSMRARHLPTRRVYDSVKERAGQRSAATRILSRSNKVGICRLNPNSV